LLTSSNSNFGGTEKKQQLQVEARGIADSSKQVSIKTIDKIVHRVDKNTYQQ
jgi:hypothetical protein